MTKKDLYEHLLDLKHDITLFEDNVKKHGEEWLNSEEGTEQLKVFAFDFYRVGDIATNGGSIFIYFDEDGDEE